MNINQVEKNYIEINVISNLFKSCIKCLDAHPKNPNLFAIGTYFGEIILIDLLSPESILYSSKIDNYYHKECIISVKWVKNDNEYVKLIVKLSYY